jgi:nicotinamidase-related amidase
VNSPAPLLQPAQCALLLIDHQAGLAFGVGSTDRQVLLNNTVALARIAAVFDLPVVVSTSASKVYSGPLMPPIQAVLPGVTALERRNMNVWEDDAVREAVIKTQRRRLIVSGLLTEACVSFRCCLRWQRAMRYTSWQMRAAVSPPIAMPWRRVGWRRAAPR